MFCIWNGLQLRRCSVARRGIATIDWTMTIVKQKRVMAFRCFIRAQSGTALTAERERERDNKRVDSLYVPHYFVM